MITGKATITFDNFELKHEVRISPDPSKGQEENQKLAHDMLQNMVMQWGVAGIAHRSDDGNTIRYYPGSRVREITVDVSETILIDPTQVGLTVARAPLPKMVS